MDSLAANRMSAALMVDGDVSHVHESVSVALRLTRLGYRVEYLGPVTREIEVMVTKAGFIYRQLDGLWTRRHHEFRSHSGQDAVPMLFRPLHLLREAKALRALKRRLDFDLYRCELSVDRVLAHVRPAFVVLHSSLLAYYPLFWARGTPAALFSAQPLVDEDTPGPSDELFLPSSATASIQTWLRASWFHRRIRDVASTTRAMVMKVADVYRYRQLIDACAARARFPARDQLANQWEGSDPGEWCVQEWRLWIAEADLPRRRPMSPRVSYIGLGLDQARHERHVETPGVGPRRRLIYVSVSGIYGRWNDAIRFLRKVIHAVRDLPASRIVIATGDRRVTALLGTPAANITVVDTIAQLKMFDVAALTITQGDSTTFRECVRDEVPMLVYPESREQLGIARRIVFHQVGLSGDLRRDTAEQIRSKAIRLVADETFRVSLRRLKRLIEASEDQLLAGAVQQLLGKYGASSSLMR